MKRIFTVGAILVSFILLFAVKTETLAQSPTFSQNRNKLNQEERKEVKAGNLKNTTKLLNLPGNISNTKVSSISGTVITVTTSENKTVTVNTDNNTKYRRRFWGSSSLSEISKGDELNIWGRYTNEEKTTMNARLIRNLSIQKRQGVFIGTVQSKTTSGFTLVTVNRGNQAVTIDAKTKYFNRKGLGVKLNDIADGNRVKVRGLWDNKLSTITEVTRVTDFSIPAIVTPTPKK